MSKINKILKTIAKEICRDIPNSKIRKNLCKPKSIVIDIKNNISIYLFEDEIRILQKPHMNRCGIQYHEDFKNKIMEIIKTK